MHKTLYVFPDAGPQVLLDAINNAQRSLRLKMFVFDYEPLLQAVVAAHVRGVKVRVMLNPARRDGDDDNANARKALLEAGVQVHDSNPSFALTHEKSLVIDDAVAFIMSLNWEERNLTQTRDYAVETHHASEVAEIAACFDADWNREKFEPWEDSPLIWCNSNGRERFANFIDNARASLWLQNERYQDAVIIERVVRAVKRGVKVYILARPPHTLKKDKLVEGVGGLRIMQDVGAATHKLHSLRLHGKMMMADEERAIIGSVNLSPGSFDSRRELAIETDSKHVVQALAETARKDWGQSLEMDLSDEGLLAEFEKHGGVKKTEELVLNHTSKKA